MPHLIESVADLTARSDRDELEITLASVTAKLLCASRLTFWRIASHGGELRLEERVRLTEGRLAICDPHPDMGDLPALESRADLRACHQSKTPIKLRRDQAGQHGHVFPVTSARGVVGFMEIYHPTPMAEEQHRLVSGLLSIYRNHLRILDYSEYDELTGLLNRKTFDGSFANFARRCGLPGLSASNSRERLGARRPANRDQQAVARRARHRFFQAHQRSLRPSLWRRGTDPAGAIDALLLSRSRSAVSLRRRGIRRHSGADRGGLRRKRSRTLSHDR